MTISEQQTSLFFRLSISFTVFAALFKYVSWPLITMGAAGMIVFHSLQLFQKEKKQVLDYARHALIVTFSFNYVFNVLELPFSNLLMVATRVTLIIFMIFYVIKIIGSLKENSMSNLSITDLGTENLAYLLADIATVYIVVASLFKILHWQFGIINANFLFGIGLFTAVISILTSPKGLKR